MFVVTRRATVLVPSGTTERPDLKHLFILLNDPHGEEQKVLIVSISTIREGRHYDGACRLFAGDHPFIRVDSWVVYAKARIETSSDLVKGVAQQVLIQHEPMPGEVFARICQGVLDSRHTPRYLKEFFRPIWQPE